MADFDIYASAYCKLILHCAKYPHCAINGVLLTDKTKNKDTGNITIVDAIPLFHLSLGLSPMMEVALTQIDAYCKNRNLNIAGYYQANENCQDSTPNNIAYRIVERIHDHFNDACLIMIENEKLSSECDQEAIQVYRCHDNKWKPDPKALVGSEALGSAAALLRAKAHRDLVDFDNHLDDISLDWRNQPINDIIARST